jgi:hypothetical protein
MSPTAGCKEIAKISYLTDVLSPLPGLHCSQWQSYEKPIYHKSLSISMKNQEKKSEKPHLIVLQASLCRRKRAPIPGPSTYSL